MLRIGKIRCINRGFVTENHDWEIAPKHFGGRKTLGQICCLLIGGDRLHKNSKTRKYSGHRVGGQDQVSKSSSSEKHADCLPSTDNLVHARFSLHVNAWKWMHVCKYLPLLSCVLCYILCLIVVSVCTIVNLRHWVSLAQLFGNVYITVLNCVCYVMFIWWFVLYYMHCPAWQILCNPAFVLQYK